MYSILFLALISFLSCLALTPVVRVLSRAHGVLDQPDVRKRHTAPIPRTGGVAIAAAYLCAVGALLLSPLNGAAAVNLPLMLRLLPAAGLVFAAGLIDDLMGMRAWHKLGVQVIASCLAYQAGVQVGGVAGMPIHGYASLLVTVVWLVGCSNAFNLIDGVDGLATGAGLFAAFTTLTAALLTGNAPLALATAPLVGALLAFLRYNFNPASIFLGDSGSLTIGFALGCFGAVWSQKSTTLLGMTAPLMALAVPLLDTCIAIVRRYIRRQPIFSPDRNHVHHRLLDRGLSPRKVALVLYGACGLAAAFSIVQTLPQNKFHGVLLVLFCVAAWVGIQFAGYAEFDVAKSLVAASTFRDTVQAQMVVAGFEATLTAAAGTDDYWQAMRAVSRDLGVSHIRMSLNGRVYEDQLQSIPQEPSSTVRVSLNDTGYVNFTISPRTTLPHALAMTSVVNALQRAVAARHDNRMVSPVPIRPTSRSAGPRGLNRPEVIREARLRRVTDSS